MIDEAKIAELSSAVTDEEFASQVAKYVASIPVSVFVRMKPGAITEDILAMAREKGYQNGPRFLRYFKTLEGQAFYMERYRLELRTRRPIPELALTQEEKRRVVSEFKQVMGREPTPPEMYELYAEELEFKRKGVPV